MLHIGFVGIISWPVFLAAGLIILIWRNASEAERLWMNDDLVPMLSLGSDGSGRWKLVLRISAGALLGAGGILVLILGHPSTAALRPLGGALLVIAAIVVIFGPWWLSLARDLHVGAPGPGPGRGAGADGGPRPRLGPADAGAHPAVGRRPPERGAPGPGPRARAAGLALRGTGARDASAKMPPCWPRRRAAPAPDRGRPRHHGPGRAGGRLRADRGLRALLDAAREATVNAAKWSGAPQVSLYAEVEPDAVMLFVRDRGRGFDPEAVPADRQGIAQSIKARMARYGGAVVIRSAPGEGTEVELSMPRRPDRPMTDGRAPRMFLVEDHAVFRAGVRAELGDAVEVVGEADEVAAAIELINERIPDVVLLDVHLPGGGGQAVLHGVLPHHPEVQFLALSVSDAPEDVIAVIRAGARGYITKTISGGELLQAVYRVAAGDAVFSPRLAGFVLDAFAQCAPPRNGAPSPVSIPSSTSSRPGSARSCG